MEHDELALLAQAPGPLSLTLVPITRHDTIGEDNAILYHYAPLAGFNADDQRACQAELFDAFDRYDAAREAETGERCAARIANDDFIATVRDGPDGPWHCIVCQRDEQDVSCERLGGIAMLCQPGRDDLRAHFALCPHCFPQQLAYIAAAIRGECEAADIELPPIEGEMPLPPDSDDEPALPFEPFPDDCPF